MRSYILRRLLYMIIVVFAFSIVSFIIIQLPPGDYLNSFMAKLMTAGGASSEASAELVEAMRESYGLNKPLHIQYLNWMKNIFKGDFGWSLEYRRPVAEILAERLPLTILISLLSLIFVYAVAIPIGIYSATHQYTFLDYTATVFGFAGLATPNFILALVLMVTLSRLFGFSAGGLFSVEFLTEDWSWAKFIDLLKHLPVPIIVIGTAGTAGLIRVMRGCLLDELRKQYVVTARAKGVSEKRLLMKYPVRIAITPIISTIGWMLPAIVAGETITSIVLSLPTVGPVLFNALMSEDMYLSGSIILMLTTLTVVGTFLSDILLTVVDPRVRYTEKSA